MQEFCTVGFVGAGNMGSALIEGLVDKNWPTAKIYVHDRKQKKQESAADSYEVQTASSLEELSRKVELVILCVKPQDLEGVLAEIEGKVKKVISIAAGVSLQRLRQGLGTATQIIRIMPNTPAQVGAGISFIAPGQAVNEDFLDVTKEIFSAVGRVEVVDESKMNPATALSGSGPAYVFYFLEALQEAGVYLGLDRGTAENAACQTLLGAGKLAEESEASFSELREAVSSPGGTTVEALKHLEENGVKGKLIEAIHQAKEKAEELEE